MKNNDLDNWRREIDSIDDQIIKLLAQRIETIKKIGRYKLQNNIPPRDDKRWHDLLQSLTAKGKPLNLSSSLIKTLYTQIHEYSVSIQKKLQ